jgi:GTPase SAR1 family protein
MNQDQALDLLKTGKNVFLTGAAGSGKTYLLNKYINYLKEHQVAVAVTASTGIAATHLQGTTIHSWSGMGVRNSLSGKEMEKIMSNSRIKRNYKKTKVLIIDEISMLHKDQLDTVDSIARYVLDSEAPFGGIQVVVCGDFFQLPPVTSAQENSSTPFAFESSVWDTGDFHVCYLHEQHRQGDDPLLTVLNDIRSGTAGEHTKVPLRTRYKKEPEGDMKATKLYSRNVNVDSINEQALSAINERERVFGMKTHGFSALVDGLKKSCLAHETLRLKIGAEVMFIKNDVLGDYVNGTRGVVVGFDNNSGWPVVKTYDNQTIIVYPEEWKYEDNGIVRATIAQVPLRLAWAITIHKSQGMTLDAAEMDLGDTFEPGMGYVALSRVRKLSGLKLMNLNEMALRVHPQILQQDRFFKAGSEDAVKYLESLPEKELSSLQLNTLLDRFSGRKIAISSQSEMGEIPRSMPKVKAKKEKPTPTHLITLDFIKEKLPVKEVAEKRGLTVGTIITHLEKLRGEQRLEESYIKHLRDMLPTVTFDAILSEFKQSEDGKLQPIFDKFEGKYTYDELRVVRFFAG